MSPQEARRFLLILTGLALTVACLPIALVGYPVLAVVGLSRLANAFLIEGRPLWPLDPEPRGTRDAALWSLCLGFVVILHGILIGIETPFTSPSSLEEKRLGRAVAYCGGGLALGSAIAAYAFDREARRSAKKPGVDFLDPDDLPG
jgi:hypothetical protein